MQYFCEYVKICMFMKYATFLSGAENTSYTALLSQRHRGFCFVLKRQLDHVYFCTCLTRARLLYGQVRRIKHPKGE